MSDLSGFNANDVPESTYGAMPAGLYQVMAGESDRKPAKSGNGDYLQFVIDVLDEKYNSKKLWLRLNLWNNNDTARQIAQRELADFCKAVGVITPEDSAELLNIPFVVDLIVTKDKSGKEQNEIHKFYSLEEGAAKAAEIVASLKPAAAAKPAVTSSAVAGTNKPVWPGAPTK